jgi:AraC-like DNA-binding protein
VANFYDYFPVSTKMGAWGIRATSFGEVRVPPRAPYPPGRHPESHALDWAHGRTLQDYQLLYIRHGRGSFESSATKLRKVGPHTIFLLFPGVWHRYRPDAATGWTESWIEMNGSALAQLEKAKIIDARSPLYRVHGTAEVDRGFAEALALARDKPALFPVRLGLLALKILTLVRPSPDRSRTAPRRIDDCVSKAQALFAQKPGVDRSAREIASQLGVSYSYIRREFKQQTGLSPKQYCIEIRHRRAMELLRTTALTIKEIAETLGYSSTYHLSLEFTRRAGQAPTKWREAQRV